MVWCEFDIWFGFIVFDNVFFNGVCFYICIVFVLYVLDGLFKLCVDVVVLVCILVVSYECFKIVVGVLLVLVFEVVDVVVDL